MAQPYILCIETATAVCSVALFAGDELVAQREEIGFVHSAKTAVFIQECLTEASIQAKDLSAVAVDIGPGSYTGLRVGLSTAKGICFALDLPLITLSGLNILAQVSRQLYPEPHALHMPMIDARRMEVYTKAFNASGETIQEAGPFILQTDSFHPFSDYDRIYCSGDGSKKLDQLDFKEDIRLLALRSDARHMGGLAFTAFRQKEFADLRWVEPNYIKPPNITKSKKTLL